MPAWLSFEPIHGLLIHVGAAGERLCRLSINVTTDAFTHGLSTGFPGQTVDHEPANPVLREAERQLRAYFGGKRKQFDLPLDLHGTAFQKRVWAALQAIPYGATRSYGHLAAQLGNAKASRAVGAANGANPVAIVVPCHRVVAADGSLGGFGAGLNVKRILLDLESRWTAC